MKRPLQAPRAPRVSVLVVTHNHADWIIGCLQGLARQEKAPSFETIVVDTASDDGTPDLVRRDFPKVTLLETKNRGFGAANNAAAKVARGQILVGVNPDTRPEPDWMRTLVKAVKPRTIATSVVTLMQDTSRVNTIGLGLHFTGHGCLQDYGSKVPHKEGTRPVGGFSGAAFAMLAEDYRELRGFDETIFLYNEDAELSWRAREQGFHIVAALESRVAHDYRPRGKGEKIYDLERSRLIIVRRHLRLGPRILFAPSLFLARLMSLMRLGPRRWWRTRREARKATKGAKKPPRGPRRFLARSLPLRQFGLSVGAQLLIILANVVFFVNTLFWAPRRL